MELKEGEIIMYGTLWCGDTRRARAYLDKNNIPYRFINIDRDRDARAYVEKVNNGFRSVPTILFPDNSMLVEPSENTLAGKCAEFIKIDS